MTRGDGVKSTPFRPVWKSTGVARPCRPSQESPSSSTRRASFQTLRNYCYRSCNDPCNAPTAPRGHSLSPYFQWGFLTTNVGPQLWFRLGSVKGSRSGALTSRALRSRPCVRGGRYIRLPESNRRHHFGGLGVISGNGAGVLIWRAYGSCRHGAVRQVVEQHHHEHIAGLKPLEQHGQLGAPPALDAGAGSWALPRSTTMHLYPTRGDVQKRLNVGHLVRRSHQLLGTSFP